MTTARDSAPASAADTPAPTTLSAHLHEAVARVAPEDPAMVQAVTDAVIAVLRSRAVAQATVWALLKERMLRQGEEPSGPPEIMGIYADKADLLARVERVATANAQYPMRKLGDNQWRVGPEEDEGFFGHRPVTLYAREAPALGLVPRPTEI